MESFSQLVGKVVSDPRKLDVMPIGFFSTSGACLKPENPFEDAGKIQNCLQIGRAYHAHIQAVDFTAKL